jgi:hypothetical protein
MENFPKNPKNLQPIGMAAEKQSLVTSLMKGVLDLDKFSRKNPGTDQIREREEADFIVLAQVGGLSKIIDGTSDSDGWKEIFLEEFGYGFNEEMVNQNLYQIILALDNLYQKNPVISDKAKTFLKDQVIPRVQSKLEHQMTTLDSSFVAKVLESSDLSELDAEAKVLKNLYLVYSKFNPENTMREVFLQQYKNNLELELSQMKVSDLVAKISQTMIKEYDYTGLIDLMQLIILPSISIATSNKSLVSLKEKLQNPNDVDSFSSLDLLVQIKTGLKQIPADKLGGYETKSRVLALADTLITDLARKQVSGS